MTAKQPSNRESPPGGPTRPRAYMLLDIRPGFLEQAQRWLRGAPGVVSADMVNGSPDLIVMTEAAAFEDLVHQTINALITVQDCTEAVRCLPVRTTVARPGATASASRGGAP